MASQPEMSEASFLDQLISSRNRDLSLFLPLILGFTSSPRRESDDPDRESEGRSHERIILINPFTQGMIVIEGAGSLEALLRDAISKNGPPPASKASIEAMPKVEISEEEGDGECAICLEGWEIGGEAREMPCKHRYHSSCIETWLGLHGSCPICRFKMPVDEEECRKRSADEEGRGRRIEREIWVSLSFSNNSNSSSDTTTNNDNDDDDNDGNSTNKSKF
uniref:RING-type E3 ubiquitin transferase n=1 Tax=Nelumbo nucifera TaxID=4432 RepID=A0A822YJY0_NELNU|nr:TPA_asm: hypothetical protein HUJ06_010126 [Nelumbo nucifera]